MLRLDREPPVSSSPTSVRVVSDRSPMIFLIGGAAAHQGRDRHDLVVAASRGCLQQIDTAIRSGPTNASRKAFRLPRAATDAGSAEDVEP